MAKLTQKELAASVAAAAAASAAEDTDTAAKVAFEVKRDALAYEMIVEDITLSLAEAKSRATTQLESEAAAPTPVSAPGDSPSNS